MCDSSKEKNVASEELKPCPFCGHDAWLIQYHNNGPDPHRVDCSNEYCAVSPGVCGETREEAVALWNRRDGDPASCVTCAYGVGGDCGFWERGHDEAGACDEYLSRG